MLCYQFDSPLIPWGVNKVCGNLSWSEVVGKCESGTGRKRGLPACVDSISLGDCGFEEKEHLWIMVDRWPFSVYCAESHVCL